MGKYLKEVQVIVQLALLGSSIEAHAAGVQQDTDKPDPKEVVGHVNWAGLSRNGATVGWKSNISHPQGMKGGGHLR